MRGEISGLIKVQSRPHVELKARGPNLGRQLILRGPPELNLHVVVFIKPLLYIVHSNVNWIGQILAVFYLFY